MNKLISIVLTILLLSSCITSNVPSLNMLEKRANYGNMDELGSALASADNPIFVPERTKPSVADIWIHPHEMPTGDYFRGGWIRTVFVKARWEVEKKPKLIKIK